MNLDRPLQLGPATDQVASLHGFEGVSHCQTTGSAELALHVSASTSGSLGDDSQKPSKGQRYRHNKKAASASLEARIEELRQAIESQETEKQALLLQQKALEREGRPPEGAADSSETQSQVESTCSNGRAQMRPEFLPALLGDRRHMLNLNISPTLSRQMTVDEAANMPNREFVHIWKEAITQLTELLLAAGGDSRSEAGRSVIKCLADWELVVGSKRLHNQLSAREIFSSPDLLMRHIGADPKQVPPVDWDQVIAAMNITEKQRAKLLEVRRVYLAAVRKVMRERQAILNQLQEVQAQQQQSGTLQDLTQQAKQYQELLTDFNTNLDQDLTLHSEMTDETKKRILTLFQKANMLVLTWPHVFDILELLNQIAAQANEPTSDALLGKSLRQ